MVVYSLPNPQSEILLYQMKKFVEDLMLFYMHGAKWFSNLGRSKRFSRSSCKLQHHGYAKTANRAWTSIHETEANCFPLEIVELGCREEVSRS